MVQATFTVSGADFNAEVFEQIKAFINGKGQNFEVFIKVKTTETREEMRSRIEKVMDDTEKGINLINFTGDEYNNLIQKLSPK
jgi:low affinity Fe/Cu permease